MLKAETSVKEIINRKIAELSELEKLLEMNNPLYPLSKGFAIVSQNGKTVKTSTKLKTKEPFEIRFGDGVVKIK